MLKLDVSVFLIFSFPVFLLKHSYDFTKSKLTMFGKFWFSGSNFSEALVAAFYFYRIFKKNCDKNQLAAIGGTCAQSLPIILAILTRLQTLCTHVCGTALVLIHCGVEHCTEKDKFLFKKYSRYIFVNICFLFWNSQWRNQNRTSR